VRNEGQRLWIVATPTVIAGMQSDAISGMVASWIAFIASVAAKTTALGWITLGAWVSPALYIAAMLFFTSEEDRTDDTQRARNLDSVKTLVTAAGLTIGVVISTALKPENAPSGWTETIRSGVIALAVSIGCSVVTLFMLSVLYDIVGDKVLKRRQFLMVAPFMYFALAMFFTGFIYVVQLTTLVVAQPKLPPGGHPYRMRLAARLNWDKRIQQKTASEKNYWPARNFSRPNRGVLLPRSESGTPTLPCFRAYGLGIETGPYDRTA
jgi:hypothetical protein